MFMYFAHLNLKKIICLITSSLGFVHVISTMLIFFMYPSTFSKSRGAMNVEY